MKRPVAFGFVVVWCAFWGALLYVVIHHLLEKLGVL